MVRHGGQYLAAAGSSNTISFLPPQVSFSFEYLIRQLGNWACPTGGTVPCHMQNHEIIIFVYLFP